MEQDNLIEIGLRNVWGGEQPFGLSPADRRHHTYVIGKTGSGKTTLLRNLILQDIRAGRGVGVVDPHGDLAHELLDFIPRNRINDVVYLDPADLQHPIGLNLLHRVSAETRHLAASGIVGAFRNLWIDSWGPRTEYILTAAVAALLDAEGTTLLGVQRMFSDPRYLRWVVRQIKDPVVRGLPPQGPHQDLDHHRARPLPHDGPAPRRILTLYLKEIPMSKQQLEPNTNKPVHAVRHRNLKASIWVNQTEKGPMYNVTVTRSYREADGWHDSNSFSYDDLMNVAKLMYDAHSFISAQRAREAAARQTPQMPERQPPRQAAQRRSSSPAT